MLAKLTSKNQLTIPKSALNRLPKTTYFDVEVRNHMLLLQPVEVRPLQGRPSPITPAQPRWPDEVDQVVRAFTERVKQSYGARLVRIIVYGSYARGTATTESDVDLAVILRDMAKRWHEHEQLHDIAYAVTYGSNRPLMLSVVPVDAQAYEEGATSFIRQIKAEGVPLT